MGYIVSVMEGCEVHDCIGFHCLFKALIVKSYIFYSKCILVSGLCEAGSLIFLFFFMDRKFSDSFHSVMTQQQWIHGKVFLWNDLYV